MKLHSVGAPEEDLAGVAITLDMVDRITDLEYDNLIAWAQRNGCRIDGRVRHTLVLHGATEREVYEALGRMIADRVLLQASAPTGPLRSAQTIEGFKASAAHPTEP